MEAHDEIESEAMPSSPEEWLDQHGDLLFAYALARVRNRETAEDLVQETFVAAIRSLDTFRGQSSLRTWLVGILRHKIMDHFRRNSRIPSQDASDRLEEAPPSEFNDHGVWARELLKWPSDPSGTIMQREFWGVFEACLKKLPPTLFSAYCLREINSCETDEVCESLGISSANLSVRLFRARMFLRRCLEQHWFEK